MARPTVCYDKPNTSFYMLFYSPPYPWPGILQVTEDPPGCPQVGNLL